MTREQVLKHASGHNGLLHSPKFWSQETKLNVMQLYSEGRLRVAWIEVVLGVRGERLPKQAWFIVGPRPTQSFTDEENV